MIWVGYAWITRLVQETQSHAFTHLLFALAFGLSAYNFFRAVTLDPGNAPKPSSEDELKTVCGYYLPLLSIRLIFSCRSLKTSPQMAALMGKLSAFNAWCGSARL